MGSWVSILVIHTVPLLVPICISNRVIALILRATSKTLLRINPRVIM
ncbi:hypothetical protein Kompost2_00001 [Pseudomonas phage vB_PpuP-Kompost-2]